MTSCKHATKIKEFACSTCQDDSLLCNVNKINAVLYGKTSYENIYLYNDVNYNRIICCNAKGKAFDTICYPNTDHAICQGIYPLSLDSFAILFPQSLLLYNQKTCIQKKYSLCNGSQKCASNDECFLVKDSLAFFYKFSNGPPYLNTKQNWDLYSDTTHWQAEYNLHKDRFENINDLAYPKDLYKDNCYYSWGNHCVNTTKHEIITSYAYTPAIVIFNYLTNTSHTIIADDPDFTSNQKFDFEQIFDYKYLMQYLTENTRFAYIKYNPFRNEYYRELFGKMNYYNKDSTVNLPYDKPFFVEVLDCNLNITEKISFPGKIYSADIIPIQDGFLMGRYSNIHSIHTKSAYGKFKL
jgi:hypothetical protein